MAHPDGFHSSYLIPGVVMNRFLIQFWAFLGGLSPLGFCCPRNRATAFLSCFCQSPARMFAIFGRSDTVATATVSLPRASQVSQLYHACPRFCTISCRTVADNNTPLSHTLPYSGYSIKNASPVVSRKSCLQWTTLSTTVSSSSSQNHWK